MHRAEEDGNVEGFRGSVSFAGVEGLSQRLANMRSFVQQQITTLTAKQVCVGFRWTVLAASLSQLQCGHGFDVRGW